MPAGASLRRARKCAQSAVGSRLLLLCAHWSLLSPAASLLSPVVPYQVGAYYLGMWSPQAYNPVDLSFSDRSFYVGQGQDWWLGVRTIHDGNLSSINATDANWVAHGDTYRAWFSSTPELKRKPAIGFYDVSQDATLAAHIAQATAHGLTFFNFYYYWQAYTNSEEMADALHSFVRVTQASGGDAMKFTLSLCMDGWYHSMVRSDIPTVAALLAQNYFARPNYLRTAAGSPIVQLCNVVGIMEDSQLPTPPASPDWSPTGPIATFISALRNASLASTGHLPTILGRYDMAAEAYVDGLDALVDGGTCVLSWEAGDGDYLRQATSTYANLNGIRTKKPFMPCVANNMDERPRMGIMKNGGAADFAVMSNYSLYNFNISLHEARRWVDDQADELSKMLTVYAWNEWHEGGIIEPSEAEGEARVAAVQAAFGLQGAARAR